MLTGGVLQQDYYFNDVESEQADCRISDTGAPKFNGGSRAVPACRLLR